VIKKVFMTKDTGEIYEAIPMTFWGRCFDVPVKVGDMFVIHIKDPDMYVLRHSEDSMAITLNKDCLEIFEDLGEL